MHRMIENQESLYVGGTCNQSDGQIEDDDVRSSGTDSDAQSGKDGTYTKKIVPMTKLVTTIEKTHFIIEFLELNLTLFGLDNNGMYNKSAFPTRMVSELKQKSFVVDDEA